MWVHSLTVWFSPWIVYVSHQLLLSALPSSSTACSSIFLYFLQASNTRTRSWTWTSRCCCRGARGGCRLLSPPPLLLLLPLPLLLLMLMMLVVLLMVLVVTLLLLLLVMRQA